MKRRMAIKLIGLAPLLPEVPWKALLPPARIPNWRDSLLYLHPESKKMPFLLSTGEEASRFAWFTNPDMGETNSWIKEWKKANAKKEEHLP